MAQPSDYQDPQPDQPPQGGDPWTPEELAAAQQQANAYYSGRQIPNSWGTPDDLVNAWAQARRSGNQIDINAAGSMLGWDKFQPAGQPTPTTTITPTTPNTPDNPVGGNRGAGSYLFDQPFRAPQPVNLGGRPGIEYIPPSPTFSAPAFPSIPRFKAPTVEEATASPGYQFRVGQGRDSLQNWAAARGTLNDSSTAKALEDYGQEAASQEYQNVWNRDFNAYQSDVNTQYLDPYAAAFQGWNVGTVQPQMAGYATEAAAGQHQNDLNYSNAWNQWLQDFNIFRDKRDTGLNWTLQ